LTLPGCDPETVDVAALHRLLADANHPLGQVGSRLGTTLDGVRHLCENYPTPASLPKSQDQARVRSGAIRHARSALSKAQFASLYLTEQRSITDIAADVGVGRSTITRLAGEYGIALRDAHRHARKVVDRGWLYQQYVTRRRTLVDIGRECGMSSTTIGRRAREHKIPVRRRGGRASDRVSPIEIHAPRLLRPALIKTGGWQRLERFAAAARYPSLLSVKQQLGLGKIDDHIQDLERDLGTQLLVRAGPGGSPMQLTDAGRQVLAAVRTVQRSQNRGGQ
jgi:DNA-binding MarR family transcriptional regulator